MHIPVLCIETKLFAIMDIASKIRCVDSMLTFEVTPVTILFINPPHHGYWNATVMVIMMDSHPFDSCQLAFPCLRLS